MITERNGHTQRDIHGGDILTQGNAHESTHTQRDIRKKEHKHGGTYTRRNTHREHMHQKTV